MENQKPNLVHGLDGIKNNLLPPPPVEENLFDDESAVLKNLKTLPDTLDSAKNLAFESEFVKKILSL